MKKGVWTKYEMTEEQYRILVTMKTGCWICGRTTKKDGTRLRLYIDHDHATGRVRGILCYEHNRRLIGRRREGSLYRKAADYLDSKFDGRTIDTSDVRLPRKSQRGYGRPGQSNGTKKQTTVDHADRVARKSTRGVRRRNTDGRS